jgi:PAS domain S-box-containing protein
MKRLRPPAFLIPIRLPYLVLATIALALIFFALTWFGIQKARQSLETVMVDEGRALIESLTLSSNNAIQAQLLLETLTEEKLLDMATLAAEQLYGATDPEAYQNFREESGLLSIDILDSQLVVIGSDRWVAGIKPTYPDEVQEVLDHIEDMARDYQSVMVHTGDSLLPVIQYFIYTGFGDGAILVMAAEASYFDQIMSQIGIGYLIQNISRQTGIEYIILQSREGIIFSSRDISPIPSIANDRFLDSLMSADTVGWRRNIFEGEEVLEIARKFESVLYPTGIYRIGLQLDEFHDASSAYDRQIIITAVVLFLLTVLVVAVVSLNQNYFLLDQSYRRMQSMTETIFDRMSGAVLAFDARQKIIAVNDAFAELFGFDKNVIGSDLKRLHEKIPIDLADVEKSTGGSGGSEREFTSLDGERRHLLVSVSSLPEEAGGGGVVLIHDITEQKMLEAENRRRERLSEMGDLAAGVAHEIRNPLNSIGIAAQRLHREFKPRDDTAEYENLSKNILNETNRLNEILTRFLALARSHVRDADIVNLTEVMEKTVAGMRHEAEERGIGIELALPDQFAARGNGEKYQQVFVNILKNSIEAIGQDGKIEVTGIEEDGTNVITVDDSGPGFPDEALAKIFQPYYTTKTDGSGLGLALSYRIITDYGGKLTAENKPEGGARIQISLPRQ